ncbi:response regulator [Deinococcus peraridilitoris]|uniref:Response regulator containing a CheY-like receiver domain and an HTH DNA-binding domain protein n=1 Tax=Deinococcus peraridilitoris (strain DSM 19664 / LMG 22246 / CIP 109416 / KR-200) TaxID=937777 RepID=K9ZX05_DEIPD|nr:response regulator [Deinococcus peraridilitoris]AFZ66173.1 response regulator containing a CheY-like receiver domain and an HTH DNA-binding domain protein [Deinococcus peraridilitoris DSM 19664]
MKIGQGRQLLLVDDNPHDLELARAALDLSDLACEVVVTTDGQDALDYLKRKGRYAYLTDSCPHLVLLDLNMPRLNGFDVLKRLKSNRIFQHVPVVVFTTSNDPHDRDLSSELGADGYVVKPSDMQHLIDVLNDLGRTWLDGQHPN